MNQSIDRSPGTRNLLVLLTIVCLCAIVPANAETFDLHIRSFCPPTSNCGASSEAEYEQQLLKMTQHLNLQWAIKGYSFRPIIFPIDSSDPLAYSTTGCGVDDRENPYSCTDNVQQFCVDDAGCGLGAECVPTQFCADLTTRCSTDFECTLGGGGQCLERNRQQRQRLNAQFAVPERDAITMFLFNKATMCCSNPPRAGKTDASIAAIFCDARRAPRQAGSVWTHEMGHYWCLSHTFTGREWIDEEVAPEHDHDTIVSVFDTPADPQKVEKEDRTFRCSNDPSIVCVDDVPCAGGGGTCMQVFVEGHDFCQATSIPGTDPGSLYPDNCTTNCQRCMDGTCGLGLGGTLINIPFDPFEHNAMSYYGWSCRAPFSVGGIPVRPFSVDQNDAIATCRAGFQRRIDLPDVCASRGGDGDHDGICQVDDNCVDMANTPQRDLDGDGEGDVCDLCPLDPTPTGDLDGDGIGDACDPDRDDDGCDNGSDQNPDDSTQVIGRFVVVGPCESGDYDGVGYTGDDSDGDGVLDCEDVDDDNDGICDENESWPLGGPGAPQGCSQGPDQCPTIPGTSCIEFEPGADCFTPWLECFGGDCNEYFIIGEDVVNPDPTTTLRFNNIQLYNRTMVADAPAGMTPATAALQLSGQAFSGHGAEAQYRLELWQVGGTEPVAILVDSYTASDVVLEAIDAGNRVIFEYRYSPDLGGMQIYIRTQYGLGTPLYDDDDDEVPSYADSCRGLYNPEQRDSDGDGFGDLCDGDVDNDGVVTQADYDLINSCDGVDVSVEIVFAEPADYDEGETADFGLEIEPTDPVVVDEVLRCLGFDLNSDGRVDYEDRNIVEGSIGSLPGPSGKVDRPPIADAGPDRAVPCEVDFPVDVGESFDPEGHTLSCSWSSPTCSFVAPDICSTAAVCPAGGLHTVELEVDDGTFTATDQFLANAGGCSPGQIGGSLRVAKGTLQGAPSVVLSWSNECAGNTGIIRYGIYEGDLGSPATSPQALTCGGVSPYSIAAANAASYFLVVPNGGPYEGSFGVDGSGSARDASVFVPVCRQRQALPVCPN